MPPEIPEAFFTGAFCAPTQLSYHSVLQFVNLLSCIFHNFRSLYKGIFVHLCKIPSCKLQNLWYYIDKR